MSEPNTAQPEAPKNSLTINVVRGDAFRLVYANLFYVQADPINGARISVLADRNPYIKKFVYPITDDNKLGAEIEPESIANQYEREVQMEIATSDHAALALFQNLQHYLRWRGLIKPEEEIK